MQRRYDSAINTKINRQIFTLLNNGILNFKFLIKTEIVYTYIVLLSKGAVILQAIYGGLKKYEFCLCTARPLKI